MGMRTSRMNQNHLPGCRCNNCGSFQIKLGDKFNWSGKTIEAIVLYKDNGENKIGFRDSMCRISQLPDYGFVVIAIHPSVNQKTMIKGIMEYHLLDCRIKNE